MPTREQVTEALKTVIDPELRRSIVELDMVRSTRREVERQVHRVQDQVGVQA